MGSSITLYLPNILWLVERNFRRPEINTAFWTEIVMKGFSFDDIGKKREIM
jgi:hypothetical protein